MSSVLEKITNESKKEKETLSTRVQTLEEEKLRLEELIKTKIEEKFLSNIFVTN